MRSAYKTIKTIKSMKNIKDVRGVYVLTKNKYYMSLIRLNCKLNNWKVLQENEEYIQVEVLNSGGKTEV